MERTLVLIKPDAVDRGLIGEVISRFEKVGLKIAGMKLIWPDNETASKHYTEDLAVRRGERVRKAMIEMITSGPVVAICLEGIESIELVRKMIGSTEPKSAAPGTIRGDYAHVSFKHADDQQIGVKNLVHASASAEDAAQEIPIWFKPEELLDHKPGYTKHTIEA